MITLDLDTQLPRDAGRLLAATMAHPLNRPVYDAKKELVVEGYSILQPRVAVRPAQSAGRSRFTQLFSGDPGIDPYTRAVSDVYQDVFQEGSFIGKGIYDVDAFEMAIGGKFPENRILSHDSLWRAVTPGQDWLATCNYLREFPPGTASICAGAIVGCAATGRLRNGCCRTRPGRARGRPKIHSPGCRDGKFSTIFGAAWFRSLFVSRSRWAGCFSQIARASGFFPSYA